MLTLIGITTALAAGGLFAYASTRPDHFRVARSKRIDAPPEAIYPLIEDFHRWASWSPYEKVDPDMKRTFGGAKSGVGAEYAWEGNRKAGVGSMRITEASAPSRVVIALEFTKPFEASNVAEFTLTPVGGSTEVTWAMDGRNNLPSKVMSIFVDMDELIGTDFATGLENLGSVAEAHASTPATS
jgi:uncharacterized protein YndB with AHSA1/START domain